MSGPTTTDIRTEAVEKFPPIVYVPCAEHVRDETDNLTVDLRRTRDGRMALMVYSALDRLIECCGAEQPWVVVPTANLDKIDEASPFDVILLDVRIPEEHRHKGNST
ncbi:MAG: SAV_915 family protein [Pseudonocardiaceae bacterium]